MKKNTNIILVSILILGSHTLTGQVAINSDGSPPDASAMLDVQSLTKGVLLPRLTSAERNAISAPAAGLVIYNTQVEALQLYDGSNWVLITDGNCGKPYYDAVNNQYYETVVIGNQCWMSRNLVSSKYNDSTDIPLIEDFSSWGALTTPGYCWYNYDSITYGDTYGALYNWYAVNTGILCPSGWHVPTDSEWIILEDYMIANGYNYDGTNSGNKIAKSFASAFNWTSSSSTGVPGNTDYSSCRNKSGFRALPGGYCHSNGPFHDFIGLFGFWWSATQKDTDNAWSHWAGYNFNDVQKLEWDKNFGFSVRCIRD